MSENATRPTPSQRLAARLPAAAFSSRFWFLASLGWFVILFILSSVPGTDTPKFPTHTDKVVHFLYFAGGGFAFASALLLRTPPLRLGALLALTLAAGALVGLLDEWHQTFTAFRSGLDLGDWIADVLGTGAGALASILTLSWHRAHATSPSKSS